MSFDVPDPFKWDDSFRVFHDSIDAGHKCIFQAIFNCSKNRSSAAHIKTFCKVTEDHFKDEEVMMERAKYEDYINHKQIHDEFLTKINRLKVPLNDASLSWSKQWLVGHIKGIDFNYKGKL